MLWYDVLYLSGQKAKAYQILVQNPVNCTLVAIKAAVLVFSSQSFSPLTRKKEESKSFGGKTRFWTFVDRLFAEPDNCPHMVGMLVFWMIICLIASVYAAVMRQELRASLFLAQGLLLSLELHSSVVPAMMMESYDMYIVVALCHCGVHPLALAIPMVYSAVKAVGQIQQQSWDQVRYALHLGIAETMDLTLFVAFTWDFTQRVRAVSSGILLGDVRSDDDPALASPAAGRSARRLCWPLVFESYLAANNFCIVFSCLFFSMCF